MPDKSATEVIYLLKRSWIAQR